MNAPDMSSRLLLSPLRPAVACASARASMAYISIYGIRGSVDIALMSYISEFLPDCRFRRFLRIAAGLGFKPFIV